MNWDLIEYLMNDKNYVEASKLLREINEFDYFDNELKRISNREQKERIMFTKDYKKYTPQDLN